jgi:hypothetical protein
MERHLPKPSRPIIVPRTGHLQHIRLCCRLRVSCLKQSSKSTGFGAGRLPMNWSFRSVSRRGRLHLTFRKLQFHRLGSLQQAVQAQEVTHSSPWTTYAALGRMGSSDPPSRRRPERWHADVPEVAG